MNQQPIKPQQHPKRHQEDIHLVSLRADHLLEPQQADITPWNFQGPKGESNL